MKDFRDRADAAHAADGENAKENGSGAMIS
jgi:hypothetical protein